MADKTKEAIARGIRTDKWYRNREVQRVFAEIKEDLFSLWVKSASNQDDERERIYREFHGLKTLESRIHKIINDGKKAQASIENDN